MKVKGSHYHTDFSVAHSINTSFFKESEKALFLCVSKGLHRASFHHAADHWGPEANADQAPVSAWGNSAWCTNPNKNATLHLRQNISQQEYSLDMASYKCSCIAYWLLNWKLHSMILELVWDVASFSVSAVATVMQYSCTVLSMQD